MRLKFFFVTICTLMFMALSITAFGTTPNTKTILALEQPEKVGNTPPISEQVSFLSLALKAVKSSLVHVFKSLLMVNSNLYIAAGCIIGGILLKIFQRTVFRSGGFAEILEMGSYVLVLIGVIFFVLWFIQAARDF